MRKTGWVVVLVLASGAWAAESSVPAWTRWEQTLTSSRQYANPFADVTVSVEYRGPNGATLSTFGFWEGGTTFKMRAMFPTPGRWTICRTIRPSRST